MAFENKAGMPIEPATFQLYVPALCALWRDSGIKEAFSRRSEYQLVSTAILLIGGEETSLLYKYPHSWKMACYVQGLATMWAVCSYAVNLSTSAAGTSGDWSQTWKTTWQWEGVEKCATG